MKALQYRMIGGSPELVEVPDPEPGPGQVLLKMTAAGVCHSDFVVMSWSEAELPFPLPLTLGHEGVGTVAALGAGVTGVAVGEDVAVYGPWGCGTCPPCAGGRENYCLRTMELGIFPPGLGSPGAIAEYMIVDDVRHLEPLRGLDPIRAVPLTDAGLTPYHAIKRSLPKLVPGSTAVVIGAGGLGHVAVQILRALSPARVIALDTMADKLELARSVGAHEVLTSDEHAAGKVKDLTGGRGATVVLDFVGAPSTTATAAACVAMEGDLTVVGVGSGAVPVGFGSPPYEVTVTAPYWGSRTELREVLDLARAGALDVHVETFAMDDAPEAYKRLHAGTIDGRAVILPNG